MKEIINEWANDRVDALVKTHPKLAVAAPYIKRGIKNWLAKESSKIDEMIATASLFVCDEDGKVDMETLFADLVSTFEAMEEQPFSVGVLSGTIGKGRIRIAIPQNVLTTMFFGDTGAITMSSDDIMELKAMLAKG